MTTVDTIPEESTANLDQLAALVTKANLQYSLKNYNGAADIYSEAAELQSTLRGDMAPENADLLYAYGRCLYKVAIAKSDVLGGRVAGEEKPKKQKKEKSEKAKADEALPTAEEKLAEEVVEAAVEEKDGKVKEETVDTKPYFQIIGDDNWDTESDEEEDGEEGEGEEEEADEDDLGNAFEILDVARVLLNQQLDTLRTAAAADLNDKGKGKASDKEPTPEERKLLERLADIHDLQAEIGLENENFHEAVNDFRSALELKQSVFPNESSLIAEAHFKLSLALEFASMTKVREAQAKAEAGEKVNPEEAKVDEDLRGEAVKQMELAIESCQNRVKKEEESLASLSADKATEAKKQIADVKEMMEEMETRLTDLRGPAFSLNAPSDPAALDPSNPINSVLAELLGQAPEKERAEQQKKIQNASDISGLVKRKKPAPAAPAETSTSSTLASDAAAGQKRKSEAPEEQTAEKKAKVGDA